MPSKDVMDRIKMARGLTAILDQLTEPVTDGLAEHLSPHLRKGEELPDLRLAHRLMGRLVMARLQVLIAADEALRLPPSGGTTGDALSELDNETLELLKDLDLGEVD